MRKQSKIRSLSTEDQKRILELCAEHTYDEVVDLVAKPRDQGGLDFKTNRGALSRFSLERGGITISSNLTCQFLDILEQQPTDFDELIPHMTNLIGQAAFLLVARHRPFEEYRRPLETFMRLEKLCREREKVLAEREQNRRAQAQLNASLQNLGIVPSSSNSSSHPTTKSAPVPPSAKPAQPPIPSAPRSEPGARPVPPVALDYALPSFQTPAKKPTPSAAANPPNIAKFPQPDAFKLPGNDSPFSHLSHFSAKTPSNLTNLTKSHTTISPSKALPCP